MTLQSIHYGDPDGVLGKTACGQPLWVKARQDLSANWASVTCKQCLEKKASTVTAKSLFTKMMVCPSCWGTRHGSNGACSYCKGQGIVPDMILSKNFLLSELVNSDIASRKGISNAPNEQQIQNLMELSKTLLQPMRDKFDTVQVNSGLRVLEVNALVGGSDTSAHPEGNAADVTPLAQGVTRKKVIDWYASTNLPYDQIIYEGSWVHVAMKKDAMLKPRRQLLMMFGGKYFPYDPKDPRVTL